MGPVASKLSITTLSSIVQCTLQDIERLMIIIERQPTDSDSFGVPTAEKSESVYVMSFEALRRILVTMDFHPSDMDIFRDLYMLTDHRGFGKLDLRDLFIAYSVLCAKSIRECFQFSFEVIDRIGSQLIDKSQLLHVLTTLNESILFFGDRPLETKQVVDLTDSIFASASKVSGSISYPVYLDTIISHPIVELVMSPQFQRKGTEKYLDLEQLETAELQIRVS